MTSPERSAIDRSAIFPFYVVQIEFDWFSPSTAWVPGSGKSEDILYFQRARQIIALQEPQDAQTYIENRQDLTAFDEFYGIAADDEIKGTEGDRQTV